MHQETWTPLLEPTTGSDERLSFTTAGETSNPFVTWFAERLQATLARLGHVDRSNNGAPAAEAAPVFDPSGDEATADAPPVRLVLNLSDIDRPRPVHRRGQGTCRGERIRASKRRICN